MKLTNYQIYIKMQELLNIFSNSTLQLPAKIGFYIQKNKNTICKLGQEIEEARINILHQYGTDKGDGTFEVPKEKISTVQNELNELFEIEQEINILKFSSEKLTNDFTLSLEQMEAIMFMIEETE